MTKRTSDTNMNELVSAMVGRSLDNRFPPWTTFLATTSFLVQHLSTKFRSAPGGHYL